MLDGFFDKFLSELLKMCYTLIMLDTETLVLTDQYKKESQRWNSILELQECLCVIFPYLSDRQFRISQFIESQKNSSLYFINLNSAFLALDEENDLIKYILKQIPNEFRKDSLEESLDKLGKTLVLTISDGEMLFKPELRMVLSMLQNIAVTNRKIKTLIAFESNIFKTIPDFNRYNLIFQNILFYPLYNSEDMMFFVDYLCKKWQMKMSQPIRKSIVYNAGGSFWLTKGSCRSYRDNNEWSVDDRIFKFRLESIFTSLSDEEKVIIASCPHLKQFEENKDLIFLKKTGLIKEDNSLAIPELWKLIEKSGESKIDFFQSKENDITYKGISLFGVLSTTEFFLLKFFLKKQNIAISRDEIAKVIWSNDAENRYSQWAIDQAIKRLRDRLISLGLPANIIRSVRGIGYEFRA